MIYEASSTATKDMMSSSSPSSHLDDTIVSDGWLVKWVKTYDLQLEDCGF